MRLVSVAGHAKHSADDVMYDETQDWRNRSVLTMMHVENSNSAEQRHAGQIHHTVHVDS